ncbi:MAG: sugar phosphate nucleotidyltransferase [Xanthobacteraceae bacterium]
MPDEIVNISAPITPVMLILRNAYRCHAVAGGLMHVVRATEGYVSADGGVPLNPTNRGRCLENLDVFVIAGGLGTRIEPVLGKLPKLLAPVSGRPYLTYLLDWLRRFGAARVVLGLGHQAHAVVDFLKQDSASLRDLAVETVVEPRPLGTAGAVRFARQSLRSDPVLVMNGDSFADADLCKFLEHHRRMRAKATLLCAEVDDAGRYGRVELDQADRIQGFVEKDAAFHGSSPVNAGVYLFSAALLDEIAAGNATSLERDVFARAPAGSLAAFTGRFAFIDIGTPQSLALAGKVIGGDSRSGTP